MSAGLHICVFIQTSLNAGEAVGVRALLCINPSAHVLSRGLG